MLAVVTLVGFWPLLDNEFINFDDDLYVTDNPRVKSGLSLEGLRWAWTTGHGANWHPLTWISHMLDAEIYGLSPAGHHLTSLMWHVINGLLLFLILDRTTGAVWPSAMVATLFALHPLHVESVAWVAERKDVLSTSFWILTIGAYVAWVARPSRWRYAAVVLSFAAGLAAKPMLVTLPLTLLLVDYWPLRRLGPENALSRLKEKLPLFVLSAVSATVTVAVQRAGHAVGTIEVYPLGDRLANAVVSYATYVRDMVWPVNLAIFYPYPGSSVPRWQIVAGVVLLAAATTAAIRFRVRRPYAFVGWLWYLVTLVPVIGLVQVGEQARADRYTYVPLIGLFVVVAWGVFDLVRARRFSQSRATVAVAAGVLILALVARTHVQTRYWHDSVTLFEHTLRVTEHNSTAHLNLALALTDRGDYPAAVDHLDHALRIRPGWAKAHNNLGAALKLLGRKDDAVEHYETALRIDPHYADAHYNLAQALADGGEIERAIERLRLAIEAEPGMALAHYNRGTLLVQLERWEEAIDHLARAVELEPDYGAARYNLGYVYYVTGDLERATTELERAASFGYAPARSMLDRLGQERPRPGDAGAEEPGL